MTHDLIGKYIWIIDTLTRYGELTREEIDRLWQKSHLSNGDPMPERTFFHYRRCIEKNFNLEIKCNSSGKYYINDKDDLKNRSLNNLMLDSFAVGSALRENSLAPGCVDIEDVPSARRFLSLVMEAISEDRKIIFTYAGFSRSRPQHDIAFFPYFVKRYKQRWYVIGLKEKEDSVRTYALDRITDMHLTGESFKRRDNITPEALFDNVLGVTTSFAPVRAVKLYVTPTQAKYFRALPLHHSQTEETHDNYSIFTYKLKLNYELTHEILSFGDAVKVLEPPELKAMVLTQLKNTIDLYEE